MSSISPELLNNHTLHAMNAYETEKLLASGLESTPVFSIEGSVSKCMRDNSKSIIGNIESGDPFADFDEGDVLRVVLRFQQSNNSKYNDDIQSLSKASTSKAPGRRRAPSTPPQRKLSASIKREENIKKIESECFF